MEVKNVVIAVVCILGLGLLVLPFLGGDEEQTSGQRLNNQMDRYVRGVNEKHLPITYRPSPPPVAETITLAQFGRIRTGMTYPQVAQILGSEGAIQSEGRIANIHTVMYMWTGSDGIANMNVMFQNGKLIQKAQFGLR